MILGIDPGREKIGLALLNEAEVIWHRIVTPAEFPGVLTAVLGEFSVKKIALGDATASQIVRAEIENVTQLPLQIVDEKNSTLQARALYWELHPPRGWRRWLPVSLQNPPFPLDDFAAVIIARRAQK